MSSLSMTKPGFTPVPTTATPQSFAALSRVAASSGYVRSGYESSSHVETMHDSASRQASNWSITFGSEDEVEWITTSAACSKTSLASAETFTPHGASVAPVTSPRSRPTFAGSVSMAPIISMACFSRISRAMDAPIGPMPYWITRIFFFTISPVDLQRAAHTAHFCRKRNLYSNGIRAGIQRQAHARRIEAGVILPMPTARHIMEPPLTRAFGGSHHASKKIDGCRNTGTPSQITGLETRQRQAASGIRMQGFRRGLWEHDSSRSGCGSDEPPSRMVQRLEQSGDRSHHAQRERDQ